jgi:crotonobetainyl-CoA:carnitine CoA-transferase CaiB-like acyl-CoA transferase
VPPLLGEHTAEVLAELGFEPAAIEDLARRHVVGL